MKRIALLAIVMFCTAQGWARKAEVWSSPTTLYVGRGYQPPLSVTFSDTETVVRLKADHVPQDMNFDERTCLHDTDGKRYDLTKWTTDGGRLSTKGKGEGVLALFFEPMPAGQRAIDLIGGQGKRRIVMLGIHDSGKPLKVEPFAYDDKALEGFRQSFFTTDSVCIRGRFQKMPADKTGTLHAANALETKLGPISVTVKEDGTFQSKFKVDYPIASFVVFDGIRIPFVALPGHTVDMAIDNNGSVEYRDEDGRASPFSRLLKSPYDEFGEMAYIRQDEMDFKEYGQRLEGVAGEGIKLCDYLARKHSFSQLEYAVARTSTLVNYACSLMECQTAKRHTSKADSATTAQLNDPENYRILRCIPSGDPIALMFLTSYIFKMNYSYLLDCMSQQAPYHTDRLTGSLTYRSTKKDSVCMAIDRKIFGREKPSIFGEAHLLGMLIHHLDISARITTDMTVERKILKRELSERKKEIYYRLYKSELTTPALSAKADKIYQEYLETTEFTHPLPKGQAGDILRRIADRFKGKYVFLEFCQAGHSECRAHIEGTKEVRDAYRNNPEVAFVFLTGDNESSEDAPADDYVSQHLKGEHTFSLTKADYAQLRELFQFSNTLHLETLDKQGNVIRRLDNYYWDMESFNRVLDLIKAFLDDACQNRSPTAPE